MPVRFNAHTSKWQADYTDQFGKRHRHGFEKKADAKSFLLVQENAVRNRTFRPDAQKFTLAEVGLKWVEAEALRAKRGEIERTSFENIEAFVALFLTRTRLLHGPKHSGMKPALFNYPIGNMLIGDVHEIHLEEFTGELIDLGYAKATVANARRLLNMLLGWAKFSRFVSTNVAQGARRKKGKAFKPDQPKIPEKETVAALVKWAPAKCRTMILFAATTGLRTSEQRALQWRHVDLERRRVTVEQRVDNHGDLGPPKSAAGYREVPLSPQVVEALREHRSQLSHQGKGDLVFPSSNGRTMLYHGNLLTFYWQPAWREMLKRWEGAEPPQKCGWHGLRHFAISTWIEKGVPLKKVQEWAGHATAAMTLDVYNHQFKSADHSEAIDAISGDIFGVGK